MDEAFFLLCLLLVYSTLFHCLVHNLQHRMYALVRDPNDNSHAKPPDCRKEHFEHDEGEGRRGWTACREHG